MSKLYNKKSIRSTIYSLKRIKKLTSDRDSYIASKKEIIELTYVVDSEVLHMCTLAGIRDVGGCMSSIRGWMNGKDSDKSAREGIQYYIDQSISKLSAGSADHILDGYDREEDIHKCINQIEYHFRRGATEEGINGVVESAIDVEYLLPRSEGKAKCIREHLYSIKDLTKSSNGRPIKDTWHLMTSYIGWIRKSINGDGTVSNNNLTWGNTYSDQEALWGEIVDPVVRRYTEDNISYCQFRVKIIQVSSGIEKLNDKTVNKIIEDGLCTIIDGKQLNTAQKGDQIEISVPKTGGFPEENIDSINYRPKAI